MKKKIIALSAALMLFAGVVSASSINGDYKGNPIVKVTSDGKLLEADEVPAQIYDGHTVVPISLLRQLGASVTWNQDSYIVDVTINSNTPAVSNNRANDYENFIKSLSSELPRDTIKGVSIDILPNGTYLHLLYSPPSGNTFEQKANDLFTYAGLPTIIKSKVDGIIIDLVSGSGNNVDVRYKIYTKDAEDFEGNKINKNQFFQKWEQTTNK